VTETTSNAMKDNNKFSTSSDLWPEKGLNMS